MKTIEGSYNSRYKEKGSKFVSVLMPVVSEEQCAFFLDELRKEHHKARHVCFAYRIGDEAEFFKSSDDGEPRNTAGVPILNQLISVDITNAMLAVIRYFGGTKLGRPGLVNAYKQAARAVIDEADLKPFVSFQSLEIGFPYIELGKVNKIIEMNQYRLDMAFYDETCRFTVSSSDHSLEQIAEHFGNVPALEINERGKSERS